MNEIEVKILNINSSDIEDKLHKLGAELIKIETQSNTIYKFDSKLGIDTNCIYRLRTTYDVLNNCADKIIFGCKIPKKQEKYKYMEEHETKVENFEEMIKIIEQLHLVVTNQYCKTRLSYKYDNVLFEIDNISKGNINIPTYLEIEATNEQDLNEGLKLLGYTFEDASSKTVMELLEEYK